MRFRGRAIAYVVAASIGVGAIPTVARATETRGGAGPSASVRPDDEPWEPESSRELAERNAPPKEPPSLGFRPATELLLPLIRLYQHDVTGGSIDRCPFRESCSAFAYRQIETAGAWGLLTFLDRFFFRENGDAYRHYRWARGAHGEILLDDSDE